MTFGAGRLYIRHHAGRPCEPVVLRRFRNVEAKVKIPVKDAKRVVFEYVQRSAHDAGDQIDLDSLSAGMAKFSDDELRLTILMDGNTRGDIWPITIVLARGELERRDAADTRMLAYRTTILSATIGVLAALAGTGFGAWLTN